MTGLLLDTNALLWLLTDHPSLGEQARRALTSGGAVQFSSVSILELTIKEMLGTVSLPGDPLAAAASAGLQELAFTGAHADALRHFPDLARHDPFDRMLLAQTRCEGRRLLTADAVLLRLQPALTLDARL